MGCSLCSGHSATSKEVKIDNMEILMPGKVRNVYICDSNKGTLVCKSIPITTSSWKREIKALHALKGYDKNMFQEFSHTTYTDTDVCIYSKFIPGCDLYKFLEINYFSEREIKIFVKKIVKILNKLHNFGIWHLDIKPENIICRNDNLFDPILIDFGHSIFHHNKKSHKIKNRGTIGYASPEQSLGKCSQTSDVWSLAITIFVCLEKKYPDENWRISISDLTLDLQDLFEKMLTVDCSKRIKISEILYHPWFK